MLRLSKYLKKFWLGLICIIALLYGQAQCELALPDYMSDIVSVGIQSGGVESVVPEIISKTTMDKTMIFMEQDEKNIVAKSYDYIIEENDVIKMPYDIEKNEFKKGVFVLKDGIDSENAKLKKAFSVPLMLVSGIESAIEGKSTSHNDEMSEMLNSIPEGMDPFTVIASLPQDQIQKIRSAFNDKMSVMGDSSLELASAQSLKQEYSMLGVDTASLQTNYIWGIGLKMLVIALGGALCAIIVGYFSSMIAAGVSRDARKDIFSKVESFSSTEFNKFSTASLITRTTNDVQQIQMTLVMALRFVIYSPIMAIGAIIRVLDSQGDMIWIIAATVILIMLFISLLMLFVGPKFKSMQKLVDRLNLLMREQLSGMLVIRAFHNEEEESKKFQKASINMRNTQLFTGRSMSLMMPVIMFIMNGVSLLIVWVGSHQVDLGTMQVGDMMAFIQYSMQIIMSFMFIAMMSIMLPRASVATKRIFEVLDTPLSINDPVTSENSQKRGLVSFKNVSFKYPNAEEEVLKNISFNALPGEMTAFIGSTGSGKSTIINLVPRFFDISAGVIEVDGVDVRKITQHDLRKKIGLVPQKGQLFHGTIASNIKYSDKKMSDERMMEAAGIAQATEFVDSKPDGYNTSISQGGTNVSGGQKQRIAIARAIAKQPEIFIFDDSFSALDFKTDAALREALNTLCKETESTMLVVAQRISSIMSAQQIIVLEEGKMVGKGTHQELMKTCEVYQEIAYSQLSKEELENE